MNERMKKIKFVVNPISGTQSKELILNLLDEKIDKARYSWEVVYTERAGHAVEIAAKAAEENTDIVVAIGGDGTINEIARSLVHTDTALGIIPCGSGGKNLSGGQRQRLTLARALVPQSDILIMDDSASALDYATDARLRKAIQDMKRKPTVFIVSQRTSSIQNADMILVLDDGKIAGQGTHEQLLKSCNIYREIYETQFKKEEA